MNAPLFHMVAAAPAPVAPYSHAVEADGWVFLTGQIPADPHEDAVPLPEGVVAQTRRTMDNLALVLEGLGLGQIVAARVFLTRFDEDYAAMNAAYESYFAADHLPARACVGVTGLARGALVEIDMIAKRAQTVGSETPHPD